MAPLHRALIGLILTTFYLTIPVTSLNVLKSSKCAAECGERTNTLASDLVCPDSSFNTSADGLTMKNCLLCLSTGTTYISDEQSDTWSFLFNQKYTLQTCLFDRSPDTSLSGCEDNCLPLRSIFKNLWYKTNHTDKTYDYCSDVFTQYAGDCASCLRAKSGSVILGNFMDTMDSACETKPDVSKGEIVTLRRSLFDATVASPSASASARGTKTGTSTATATGGGGDEEGDGSLGLSTGAKAGIGVGAGVGGLMVLGAVAWGLLVRRRRGAGKGDGYAYQPPVEQGAPYTGAGAGSYSAGVAVEQVKEPGELEGGGRVDAELDGTAKGHANGRANAVELP
ncbi:hypothetical protein BDV23DRAFT_192072 [Aspergillus alliaceus]|uniref:Uncharacterized protein n=1 Tax=Petromyces alliaceus TaxID=209559 RepID=A0A5N7CHZ7_PETAA|nr:hypothetical protein BDV23DRAFT_192072 [Aspergillus alliaceus]